MNPFVVFSLPEQFPLDALSLEKTYFALQRQYHPDRLAADMRQAAIRQSMDINQAYQILKDPLKRAQALLALRGIKINGEGDTLKPPPALLMEVMELREALEEADAASLGAFRQNLAELHASGMAELEQAFAREDWTKAGELAIRLHYFHKISEEARQKATHAPAANP